MPRITNSKRYSRYKQYAKGTIYHIYNRGNGSQDIFREDNDYRFYLNKLKENLKKHNVLLICYVLMPNHIHLVVRQETEIPIYKFISSLHTSYSTYFNKKYRHLGHVFQDRFKQVIIDSDEQLIYLSKYIHLNPIKAKLAQEPWKYLWSSNSEYLGNDPLSMCSKEILINSLMTITGIEKEDFTREYALFCRDEINDKENALLEEITIEAF